jgi:S1-C subfamily serine protease
MSNATSHVKSFVAGALAVVAVLVVLMGIGILPVRTERTTIVKELASTQTAGISPPALASGGALTAQLIYEEYSPGVVEVLATFSLAQAQGPFGPQASSSQALGSGFVVSDDRKVLTSDHVVSEHGAQAESVSVVFKDSGAGMTTVPATVVGVDETSDVALLRVDPAKVPDLQPVVLGDSGDVRPGEAVVAIVDAQGGVLVATFTGGSPAEKAGIQGGTQQAVVQNQVYVLGGDVIQVVDGEEVAGAEELAAAITEREPGDDVGLTIVRDWSVKQVSVTLGERPAT